MADLREIDDDKKARLLRWFAERVGDHLPNEHYQRLFPELADMLGVDASSAEEASKWMVNK